MHISININNKCNLKCKYCFIKDKGKNEMSKKTFSDILTYIETNIKNQSISINFFGTEPLVSWHRLRHCIEKIRKTHDWKIGITTNGTLLTPEKAKFFKENHVHLLISCDGIPQAHNKYRIYSNGKGSWQHVISAITICQVTEIRYAIAHSVAPKNVYYLLDSMKMYKNLGVKKVSLNKVLDFDKYNKDDLYHNLKQVAHWYRKNREDIKVDFIENTIQYFKKNGLTAKTRYSCGACQGSFGINWNGDIIVCHAVTDDTRFVIGHINNNSPFGINRKEQFLEFRHADSLKCYDCPVVPCATCHWREYDFKTKTIKPLPERCMYEAIHFQVCREVFPDWITDFSSIKLTAKPLNQEYKDRCEAHKETIKCLKEKKPLITSTKM